MENKTEPSGYDQLYSNAENPSMVNNSATQCITEGKYSFILQYTRV